MKKFFTLLIGITLIQHSQGQVIITEIADPNDDATARFVELYNLGVSSVDLSTWKIQRYTNGNASPATAVALTGTIAAGDFYLIAANSTGFSSAYGFSPDQTIGTGGPADSNGDDQIQLLNTADEVVDIFGVPAEDGSGTCHEFEDGRAERIASVTDGNDGTFDEAEWNVWADSSVGSCTSHTNSAQDAADMDPGSWIGEPATTNNEPTNHVLSFTATANGASQIDLTWTDNDGADPAEDFLILASTGTITPPVDGTDPTADSDLSDGDAAVDVASGTGSRSFTGLTPNTTYNFEIYPFSNSGATIDFKTDGTVPSQSEATAAATHNPGDIVITELHYNPSADQGGDSDFEFLELHNTTGSTINLENWTFTSGVTHTFTVSDEITAGEYIVLATNSANYPGSIDLDGGGLTNSGETVTLESDEGVTIDEVTYNTSEVDAPNGDGYTLSLVDVTADNSNMDFWIGSGTDGGTPGAANTDITVWNGLSSTAWETDGNWDNDAPTTGISAFIPIGANSPSITGDEVSESVRVLTGELLTISSGSLSVNGELILDGSLDVVSGASLLPLGTTSGSGDATIARSTTFGVSDGQYSVIGSTVTSGSTDDLGSIVYEYDETVAYGTNGNNRFNLLGGSTSLTIADGYFSANTGDISFIGTPNSGTKAITLVYDEANDGGSATNAGFNLVANPYPAAISYDAFAVTGTPNADIDGTIYLWDDGGSDLGQRTNADYITANSMGAASGGSGRSGDWDGYIRAGQGFFVKATTAGTLNFTADMMTTGNNTDAGFFREAKPETVRLALSSSKLYNDIIVGFSDKATVGFDRTLDAHKIKGNSYLQLYSRMGTSSLAIQALPILTEETSVPLGFDAAEAGTYTFELPDALSYGFEVYLMDHKLDKIINLSEGDYSFETTAISDSNRFSLVFSPSKMLSLDDDALEHNKLILFNNDGLLHVRVDQIMNDATVKIYDLSGTLIKQINRVDFNGQDIQTRVNGNGLYIMTIQNKDQLLVKKFMNR